MNIILVLIITPLPYNMFKKLLIALFPIVAIGGFTAETMYSTGRAGNTGSPGESTCRACHTTYALNSGGGSITIQNASMPGNVYVPGQTYTMSVTVAQSGINLFGFGLEALNAAGDNGGTLNITDPASTQIKTAVAGGFTRRNVVHTTNGGAGSGSKTFNFSWTAPAVGSGNVTFYFSGIASNANTFSSGDWVYQGTSLTVTEQPCNPPAQPVQIIGTTSPCAGTSQTYTVPADPAATSYTWALPNGWTGSSITNSIVVTVGSNAGTIFLTANNVCGPSALQTISVNPVQITASVTSSNVLCNGATNGTATVTASGGAVPYTYVWTPNVSTGSTATGLAAGNYSVTVSNAGNCPTTQSFTISEPAPLIANAGGNVQGCAGSGVVIGGLPPTGGTAPYTYQWTGNVGVVSFALAPVVTAISNETFNLVVTDANGCTASDNMLLEVSPLPQVSTITSFNDTLYASQALNYQWYLNNVLIAGATDNFIIPVANGDYTVQATDPVTGCSALSTPFTYLSTAVNVIENIAASVYPNPASDKLMVEVPSSFGRDINYQLINMLGSVMSSGTLSPTNASVDVSTLPQGCYSLLLESDNKFSASRIIIRR